MMETTLDRIEGNQEIVLATGITTCGRLNENDIVCASLLVSPRHCSFTKYPDKLYVCDLSSSNGVFVNGAKIKVLYCHELHDNDIVGIGTAEIDNLDLRRMFVYRIVLSNDGNGRSLVSGSSSNGLETDKETKRKSDFDCKVPAKKIRGEYLSDEDDCVEIIEHDQGEDEKCIKSVKKPGTVEFETIELSDSEDVQSSNGVSRYVNKPANNFHSAPMDTSEIKIPVAKIRGKYFSDDDDCVEVVQDDQEEDKKLITCDKKLATRQFDVVDLSDSEDVQSSIGVSRNINKPVNNYFELAPMDNSKSKAVLSTSNTSHTDSASAVMNKKFFPISDDGYAKGWIKIGDTNDAQMGGDIELTYSKPSAMVEHDNLEKDDITTYNTMEQEFQPTIGDFLASIFEWDPALLLLESQGKSVPPTFQEIGKPPLTFESFSDYYKIMKDQLLLETRENLLNEFRSSRSSSRYSKSADLPSKIVGNSVGQIKTDNSKLSTLNIDASASKRQVRDEQHPVLGDIVILDYHTKAENESVFRRAFAYVMGVEQHDRDRSLDTHKTFCTSLEADHITFTYKIQTRFIDEEAVDMDVIGNVRSIYYAKPRLRQVQALVNLPRLPLIRQILHVKDIEYFWSENTKTSRLFNALKPNDFQLEKTKLGDVNEEKIKLLQASLLKKANQSVLVEADIILSTLSSSYTAPMTSIFGERKNKIDTCIVDEATQCCEADTLIPLLFGVKTLLLVEDPHQLPATVMSENAKKLGLDRSMFTRTKEALEDKCNSDKTIGCENPVLTLNMQYRMVKAISHWPKEYFYRGKLVDSTNYKDDYPFHDYRVLNVNGNQDETKYCNGIEAGMVCKILHCLMTSSRVATKYDNIYTVGVLTPYRNQKNLIESGITEMTKNIPEKLKNKFKISVQTVDSFQGQESDIIIMSCVRSCGIGFLSDEKRLCVAMTRAKRTLILCGNFTTFENNDMWRSLLKDARSRGVFANVFLPTNASPGEIERRIIK